ncbi:MAG: hypothetical protein M3P94_02505 [Chloroflexota bacterium]|nr:hypothetical protein [Chloroflexota bacterium]
MGLAARDGWVWRPGAVGAGLIISFLPYLTRIADLLLGGAGLLLPVASGAALVAMPVAGRLANRFGPRTLVIVSQGLGALGFLGLFWTGSVWVLLTSSCPWTFDHLGWTTA